MMRTHSSHRASIPEIYARNAAQHSHEISLTLLNQIEETVDSLVNMERALEGLAQVAHAAERMWNDEDVPAEMPEETDEIVQTLEETARDLQQSYDVYCRKRQAAFADRRLKGENEEYIVENYDRMLDRFPTALEAIESLKWTLMNLQALSEPPTGKGHDNIDGLLADLKE